MNRFGKKKVGPKAFDTLIRALGISHNKSHLKEVEEKGAIDDRAIDRSIINGSKHARPRGSHQRGESTGLNIVINSSSVIIIMKDDESRRSPPTPRAFR